MYMHYYHELNEAHRQQLCAEAAQRRQQARLPRRPNLARHLAGTLGITLVALGSRLERLGRIERPIPYENSLHSH